MSVLSSLRSALRVGIASLTLAALLVGGTAVIGPLARADYGPVTASSAVNIRSGPATTYPKVGVLAQGESLVQAGAPSGGWVPVTYKATKAWIWGAYVTGEQSSPEPISTTGPVGSAKTTAALNVRSGPALTYPVVGSLVKGAIVTMTGRISTTWTQISLSGNLRWVSSAYLTTATTSTTLPPVASYARATADLMIRTT
ncbi:MAG TPA: SH3 domain-containing protein, partial [Propionibacteriaceae bacterium]|nr:SH3 domain-containing protein [Propionibacteriaceae bacterium]